MKDNMEWITLAINVVVVIITAVIGFMRLQNQVKLVEHDLTSVSKRVEKVEGKLDKLEESINNIKIQVNVLAVNITTPRESVPSKTKELGTGKT